jgi:hypothetical protein
MKKEFFLISEKYERTTIHQKRKYQRNLNAICEDCGQKFEWLTIAEAAELFGENTANIREKLEVLRRKIDEHENPIH